MTFAKNAVTEIKNIKEYMNNGLYNELGDFTTVSYNTEQMQEQGYIPCEKCINQ